MASRTFESDAIMMYLLAILVPPLAALFCGRFITAILLGVLQFSVVGWIPASIVALFIVSDDRRASEQKQWMTWLAAQTQHNIEKGNPSRKPFRLKV